jgi:hypothetical protein
MPNDEPQNDQHWSFHKEETPLAPTQESVTNPPEAITPQAPPKDESVTWTASEFIAQHKNGEWYMGLIFGVAALCALVLILTRDIVSVIAIILVVSLYVVLIKGHPRQRSYRLDHSGITIDQKFYSFSGFKSFSLTQEGAIGCITFMPLKRLLPELPVYFAMADGEKIIKVLAGSLPNDQRKEHGLDRLTRKLHL